jgi:hypothetical protein
MFPLVLDCLGWESRCIVGHLSGFSTISLGRDRKRVFGWGCYNVVKGGYVYLEGLRRSALGGAVVSVDLR